MAERRALRKAGRAARVLDVDRVVEVELVGLGADRVSSEPNIAREKLSCLNSIMASSHAFFHAVLGLEAGLQETPRVRSPEALRAFSHDVEFTLYFLEHALRGSVAARDSLPSLRDAHRRLVRGSGVSDLSEDYILLETDHIVVALNTLREQILKFVN